MSCARTSVGVALAEEDMRFCSELISKIIAEEMVKILAAFEVIGEAFSTAFDIGLLGWAEACEAIQTVFGELEDVAKVESGTPPKKYGMSLRRCPRQTSVHYHYIPTAPRNLPYMMRAY